MATLVSFIFLGPYLSEFSEFQESLTYLRLSGGGADEARATSDDGVVFQCIRVCTEYACKLFSKLTGGSLPYLTLLAERLAFRTATQRRKNESLVLGWEVAEEDEDGEHQSAGRQS